MAEHLIFHDCSQGTKQAIGEYWGKKMERLERLLTTFPEDQRHLRLTMRFHQPERYEAQAVLSLPTGTLVAQSEGRDAHEVTDLVVDRLAEEIRRHKGVLRE